MKIHWLTRSYQALLRLYPRRFRDEFGQEMQQVFSQAADDAQARSRLALAALWLRELAGLPFALANSRRALSEPVLADRIAPAARQTASEHSWQELALLLIVFLAPALLVLVNQPLPVSSSLGALAGFLFLGVMLVVGFLGGFPIWSLRYVGIIFVIAIYLLLFNWVAGLLSPALVGNFAPGRWDPSTYLLLKVASTGIVWLMLFCLTLLAAALLALVNRFQPLLAPFRKDWTQLSYILYGESVFALLLLYHSQRLHANYALAGMLCLLAGIWFYLRSPSGSSRMLIMMGCLTVTVWIAALDLQSLSPGALSFTWSSLSGSMIGRLLLSWLGMLAALLAPAALSQGFVDRLRTKSPASPGKPLF